MQWYRPSCEHPFCRTITIDISTHITIRFNDICIKQYDDCAVSIDHVGFSPRIFLDMISQNIASADNPGMKHFHECRSLRYSLL